MKRLLIAGATALALSACSGQQIPPDGHIVGKDYSPAYVSTSFVPCGKGCIVPSTQYIPEQWDLTILSLHNPDWKGTASVDQDTYNRCHQGDLWPQCAGQGT